MKKNFHLLSDFILLEKYYRRRIDSPFPSSFYCNVRDSFQNVRRFKSRDETQFWHSVTVHLPHYQGSISLTTCRLKGIEEATLQFKSINNPLQKLHTRMKIILIHLTHRFPTKLHYTRNTCYNMNCPLPAGAFHSSPLFTHEQSEWRNKPTCQKPKTSIAAYAYNSAFVTTSGTIPFSIF